MCYLVSQFILPITDTVIFILFHVPCTALPTVYFHSMISMCPFLLCESQSKANAINQTILLCTPKRLNIDQSNAQTARAENEEQYRLSNVIEFQNCYFFSLRCPFKQELLIFSKVFSQIYCYLSRFVNILRKMIS